MGKAQNPMRRSWLDETEGGWVAHRLRLLMSPAWQHRPRPLCTILERIEIEHMRHAGKENGHLVVTYDQFVAYGVSRRAVAPAIACGVRLGLVEVRQAHEVTRNIKSPNEYRLTYLPEKDRRAPTDEWAGVTAEQAKKATEVFKADQSGKSGGQFPFLQASSSLSCTEPAPSSSLSRNSSVPIRELTLISPGKVATHTTAAPLVDEAPHPKGARHGNEQVAGPISVSEALSNSKILQAARRGAA